MSTDYFDANQYFKELNVNVDEVRKITDFVPDVAIILGTGLSGMAKEIDVVAEVNCKQLFNFPVSTVPGHDGTFIFGVLDGVKVVCLRGRVHYYEGYPMHVVAKPIRLMYLLGARSVIITNACGGLNPYMNVGDIVAVYDHISSFVPSPLLGPNISQLGEKFVDMTSVYDYKSLKYVIDLGDKNNIPVNMGIYLQVRGPQFESPAETKMYHSLGADIIGMSATCEAISARHMGMKVVHLGLITNMTGGLQNNVNDEEVHVNAEKSSAGFMKIVRGLTSFIVKGNDQKKLLKERNCKDILAKKEDKKEQVTNSHKKSKKNSKKKSKK